MTIGISIPSAPVMTQVAMVISIVVRTVPGMPSCELQQACAGKGMTAGIAAQVQMQAAQNQSGQRKAASEQ